MWLGLGSADRVAAPEDPACAAWLVTPSARRVPATPVRTDRSLAVRRPPALSSVADGLTDVYPHSPGSSDSLRLRLLDHRRLGLGVGELRMLADTDSSLVRGQPYCLCYVDAVRQRLGVSRSTPPAFSTPARGRWTGRCCGRSWKSSRPRCALNASPPSSPRANVSVAFWDASPDGHGPLYSIPRRVPPSAACRHTRVVGFRGSGCQGSAASTSHLLQGHATSATA